MRRGLRNEERGGANTRAEEVYERLGWREDLSGKETYLWAFGGSRRDGRLSNLQRVYYDARGALRDWTRVKPY